MSINSQDSMSFVFLFLDRSWYITVFIFLFTLDVVSTKSYFLERKKLELTAR